MTAQGPVKGWCSRTNTPKTNMSNLSAETKMSEERQATTFTDENGLTWTIVPATSSTSLYLDKDGQVYSCHMNEAGQLVIETN